VPEKSQNSPLTQHGRKGEPYCPGRRRHHGEEGGRDRSVLQAGQDTQAPVLKKNARGEEGKAVSKRRVSQKGVDSPINVTLFSMREEKGEGGSEQPLRAVVTMLQRKDYPRKEDISKANYEGKRGSWAAKVTNELTSRKDFSEFWERKIRQPEILP